jgi:peptidoglycan hydrolase-like protein with peptidoglycan-binding domain
VPQRRVYRTGPRRRPSGDLGERACQLNAQYSLAGLRGVSTRDDDEIEFDFFDEPETVEATQRGRRLPRRDRSGDGGSGAEPRRPIRTPTGLVPLARLVGLIAIAITVVVALVFWVGACQGKNKHDEYASYASKVRAIAQSSTALGTEFANKLIASGLKQADLEQSLQTYAQQEQQSYDQAQQIQAPGPLRRIHQHLIDALELRAKGLAGLGDTLSQTASVKDAAAAAQKLTDEAALLTASDVVWDQLYRLPATDQMKAQGVTGVVIPDSHFVENTDLVSARSFSLLFGRLHPASTGSAPAPLLKPGDSGAAVGAWQVLLSRWLKKAQPQQALLPITRIFDPATEAATKTLQIAASITLDGIVGPATRQALTRQLARTG